MRFSIFAQGNRVLHCTLEPNYETKHYNSHCKPCQSAPSSAAIDEVEIMCYGQLHIYLASWELGYRLYALTEVPGNGQQSTQSNCSIYPVHIVHCTWQYIPGTL